MSTDKPPAAAKIQLVIADVDGTLVTQQKALTERSIAAVRKLRDAGIAFAVTSGRPPRGMSMLVEPLGLTTPIAAFNGGMFVGRDLAILDQHTLATELVAPIIDALASGGLDAWVYRACEWLVRDRRAAHVEREAFTVQFSPTVVPSFTEFTDNVAKIVGVSDDFEAVVRCEAELRHHFGDRVSASRSQPYYLDVTHPLANKGTVVRRHAALLKLPVEAVATIGDMPNDVLMFALSGLSIAMGNASPEVQRAARRVTRTNEEDGFAHAIECYVLGERPGGPA
jgi:Cof subfamily protein (haloacid dehalogenase superfamily)